MTVSNNIFFDTHLNPEITKVIFMYNLNKVDNF